MRTANVFLDTEFSSLVVARPQLLSLGLVSEFERTCYVEVANVDPAACSSFVRETVLPLLSDTRLAPDAAAAAVTDYLRSFGCAIDLWSDAPNFDVALLSELIGERRADLPPIRVCSPDEFTSAIARMTFAMAYEQAFDAGRLRRHHALDDARALREAWLAVRRVKPREIRDAAARAPHAKRSP